MKTMTVNLQGVEVQAALLNPEVTRRYEDGFDACLQKISTAANCDRGSDGIREQCQAVIDYVTDIFGKDGARKVFGEQTDLLTCLEVLGEMQAVYETQINPIIQGKVASLGEKLKTRSIK